MNLEKNNDLLENARRMRKQMTPQERHLWYDFLSKYDVRWYRQKIIYNYIVDFYCSAAKLAVEIDGSQHYTVEGMENDEYRTTLIEQFGIKVIRFSNHDVNTNFEGVCSAIDQEVRERMKEK